MNFFVMKKGIRGDIMRNELLTKKQAQEILKVGNNRMLQLLHKKEFSFKIGNKWYCNKEKMFEWMDKQIDNKFQDY